MSSPWPSTPILRCKKRFKLDTVFYNALMDDDHKENIDPTGRKSASIDQTPPVDCNPIADKENRIDLAAPMDVDKIQCYPTETRSKSTASCLQTSTKMELPHVPDDQTEIKQSAKCSRHCQSDSYLSPMWPVIGVDRLASWLRNSDCANAGSLSTYPGASNIGINSYPSEATESMTHESSSSSFLSCSLSSNSEAPSSDDENGPPTTEIAHLLYDSRNRSRNKAISMENQKHSANGQKRRRRKILIVDCRYPYEYEGGHIVGAINLAEWPKLRCLLFGNGDQCLETEISGPDPAKKQPRASRTVLILHCEFSSHRAPRMFQLLRDHDRLVHLMHYPALRYPRVYVLHGGYAAFYARYPEFCVPSAYRKMHSQPELLSKWQRHCNLVNQKDSQQTIRSKLVQSQRSSTLEHIPFLSLTNLPHF